MKEGKQIGLKIFKVFLLLMIFVFLSHFSALLMRWFANGYMHPAQPVSYGLCLFVAICSYLIAFIYAWLRLQEEEERINRVFNNYYKKNQK